MAIETLTLRLKQQAAAAELGQWALTEVKLPVLMSHAVRVSAEALETSWCAVFEREAEGTWRLVAGVGWGEEVVGQRVEGVPEAFERGAQSEGPLRVTEMEKPLAEDERPEPAVVVKIGSDADPFGVLVVWGVDEASEPGHFLAAVARTLSGALERARTARALRESEARARAIVETTVDAVISIDERGRIEGFNPAAERIFGYAADEVLGRNVNVLMPEPYHTEHDGYMQAYHETGRRRIIGIGREVTGRRKDGSTFPMDLAVSEVKLEGRTVFTGLIRDISERRQLEQEVLRIAEAERRRIGQDLHDGLGQQLTGIGLIARGLARQLEAEGSTAAEEANEVVQFIKEADEFARGLARGLVPVELEQGGLAAALTRLAANAERLFGITCTVEVDEEGDQPLPEPAHLFRIAQESVSNAVRHGRARHVAITFAVGTEQVRLRIADDGTGFPAAVRSGGTIAAPVRPDDNRGMGVRIMHYRARIMGGTLDIRPGLDGGTVVSCTVPLGARR